MPPRIRREPPARRDARIRKHLAQAKDYWLKAPVELAQGDVCQAGEKGWGTVAQLTKAVATLRGWEHYDHEAIREAIAALAGELPEQAEPIYRGMRAAEALHGNFYEVYMTPDLARFDLSEVRPLLEILWGLLPEEHTGRASFGEWIETSED
ncbi:MAG: hypothetical protein OXI54_08210 [Chloroflexota bacterium]|nr:hypothetical protein [Chloroflexota bacterium]MDE2684117.1 hypothetical protein [Chloroflexota bacterium]